MSQQLARERRALASIPEDSRLESEEDLVQRIEHLKEQRKSTRVAMDPRLKRDLDSGKPIKLAFKKYAGRVRAAMHRHHGRAQRAAEFLEMERKWHEKYDDPDAGPHASELLWDQHAVREFEGDEELEANLNRKAFTRRERTDFTVGETPSEGDFIDGMAAFQPRSWKKPQWRKANTAYANRTRNLKRDLARIRTGLTRVVRFVIQKTAQSKKAAKREVDAAG